MFTITAKTTSSFYETNENDFKRAYSVFLGLWNIKKLVRVPENAALIEEYQNGLDLVSELYESLVDEYVVDLMNFIDDREHEVIAFSCEKKALEWAIKQWMRFLRKKGSEGEVWGSLAPEYRSLLEELAFYRKKDFPQIEFSFK